MDVEAFKKELLGDNEIYKKLFENFEIKEHKPLEQNEKIKFWEVSFSLIIKEFVRLIHSPIIYNEKTNLNVSMFFSESQINNKHLFLASIQLAMNSFLISKFENNNFLIFDSERLLKVDYFFKMLNIKNRDNYNYIFIDEFWDKTDNLEWWKWKVKENLILLFNSRRFSFSKLDMSFYWFVWSLVFLNDLIYWSLHFEEIIEYLTEDGFILSKKDGEQKFYSYLITLKLSAIDQFLQESKLKSDKVFIGIPFNNKYDEIRKTLSSTIRELGYTPILIDEIEHNSYIDEKLLFYMNISKFGIFDISDKNPNVYFEAGYIKGLQKDIILICKKRKKIPFDLAHINIIFYEDNKDLKQRLLNRIIVTNYNRNF